MCAILKYFLYGVGVWLSVLLAMLLGGFHIAVEPEPHYWFVVMFGFVIGLLANLGLFLVPTAAKQGMGWKSGKGVRQRYPLMTIFASD